MKSIDIYGEPVKNLLNGNFFIKTSIGGFFTVTTVILVIIFTWFIGKDLIYKEKPNSYMQTDIFNKFLHLNLTSDKFPFSFILTDDDNRPLEDFTSYLTIKLYELTFEISEKTKYYNRTRKQEHELRLCNYTDFPLISKDQFNDAQLNFTLCPKNKTFNLSGYWNEANLNHLQISIESCKDSSDSKVSCKKQDEINRYIAKTSANLNIFYVDTRVVINNNINPLETLTTVKYKYVIPEYFKKTIFKIQTQNILTDDGFIFSESKKLQFLKMVEKYTDLVLIDPDEQQLLCIRDLFFKYF